MLVAKGFSYILANYASGGLVRVISLSRSLTRQLVNEHFADDSFLTPLEEESSVHKDMECLNFSN